MAIFWWCRINGTIIPSIWWKFVLLTIYSAAVVSIETYVPLLHKEFPTTLIDIIGLVTGMLLTFRTDTAHNRYCEGRILWSRLNNNFRRLTRAIWAGIKEKSSKDVVDKKSALNLSTAFVMSLKHYVREEYGYNYKDYEGLLDHLPRFFEPASNISLEQQIKKGTQLQAYDKSPPTNIPIEISYCMVSYARGLDENKTAEPWALDTIHNAIEDMVDCLAGFEKIVRTPMPLAYSIHLTTCVWLYLLSIPFQVIGSNGWFTIPVTSFAAIFFLGILAIGEEIENPFGYDANDLPLDDYCNVMKLEMLRLISQEPPQAEFWIYSEYNHPFGTMCALSANKLLEIPIDQAREILTTCIQAESLYPENGMKNRAKVYHSSFTEKSYQNP